MPALTLSLLDGIFCICRLPAGAVLAPPARGRFSLLVQAREETTLVCPVEEAPSGVEQDTGWHCFGIEQNFDLSVPGILASVLEPLAEAGVGIFATSTFSTDYVLVKADDLVRAQEALRAAGHVVSA